MASQTFRMLSIDGGGIRGLIPALILAEIEKRTGKAAHELFDLVAGTSTGGIISLGITIPGTENRGARFSATELAGLYEDRGGEIFSQSFWDKAGSPWDNAFSHDGLERLLQEYFGETRLSEALTQVLVTSYDIEERTTFYFNSRLAKEDNAEDFLMREVARATSAAPTYFEPTLVNQKTKRRALIDGGVFANNPSMLAYVEAKRQFDHSRTERLLVGSREAGNEDVVEVRVVEEPFFMLSLGTGTSSKPYLYQEAKGWGLIGWARPVIDILMQGVSESVHYQMNQLLPYHLDGRPRYARLNTRLDPAHSEMADAGAENIKALQKYARDLIESKTDTIDLICQQLT